MAATSAPAGEYLVAPNREVSAANGIDYTYREVGEGTPALVLLQHFRGNLDNWDPALIDALAHNRRVVTFDNAGSADRRARRPARSRRWRAMPSRSSRPSSSARSTCSASRAAASSPRRSR